MFSRHALPPLLTCWASSTLLGSGVSAWGGNYMGGRFDIDSATDSSDWLTPNSYSSTLVVVQHQIEEECDCCCDDDDELDEDECLTNDGKAECICEDWECEDDDEDDDYDDDIVTCNQFDMGFDNLPPESVSGGTVGGGQTQYHKFGNVHLGGCTMNIAYNDYVQVNLGDKKAMTVVTDTYQCLQGQEICYNEDNEIVREEWKLLQTMLLEKSIPRSVKAETGCGTPPQEKKEDRDRRLARHKNRRGLRRGLDEHEDEPFKGCEPKLVTDLKFDYAGGLAMAIAKKGGDADVKTLADHQKRCSNDDDCNLGTFSGEDLCDGSATFVDVVNNSAEGEDYEDCRRRVRRLAKIRRRLARKPSRRRQRILRERRREKALRRQLGGLKDSL